MPGFDEGTWFGIFAPAGTPKDVVAKLNAEMPKIIHSPEFRKRMEEIGAEPVGDTAQQMAARIQGDTVRYPRLFKDAKVPMD